MGGTRFTTPIIPRVNLPPLALPTPSMRPASMMRKTLASTTRSKRRVRSGLGSVSGGNLNHFGAILCVPPRLSLRRLNASTEKRHDRAEADRGAFTVSLLWWASRIARQRLVQSTGVERLLFRLLGPNTG